MMIANKSQWQMRGAALLIFLLGVLAGGLLLNVYHNRQMAQTNRRVLLGRALEQLNLTAEQKPQVEQILRDARLQLRAIRGETQPKFSAVRQQTDARLQQVLTPQQWTLFEQQFRRPNAERRPR
jgi:Spy/CpxP family protein refolding chaperone